MAAKSSTRTARLELTDNARTVLERRYLAKDLDGRLLETPEQLFRRVANNIAEAERLYQSDAARTSRASVRADQNSAPVSAQPEDIEGPASFGASESEWANRFYYLMTSLRFLPNSPTLGNAGRPLQQLSACFVLPVEDSMAAIFETVKETALIHQSGGGTGFAFSRLRPAGDIVATTGGVASGPVSFMKVFDAATEAIKQGGTRRGANMAILSVRHPDIEAFINVKADMTTLTNFNISVAVDDTFMRAVEGGEDYDLINPRTGEAVGRRSARAVFDQIVANAWQNGDPGLVFLDRINADNPTPALGAIEATNPCGEQPLLPYESCNLGSLNLSRFYKPDASARPEALEGRGPEAIDWDALAETIGNAVRFLDNVIDMNLYPVQAIADMTRQTRKIGLGLMGWADLLYQLRIPYDSEEALALADRVMAFVRGQADAASEALAGERGTFPAWEASIYGPQVGAHGRAPLQSGTRIGEDVRPLRNSTRTTVAPTGTLSIIAGCSGGIEPAFALAFQRQHFLDPKRPTEPVRLREVNPIFEQAARDGGFYSDELMEYLSTGGHLSQRQDVPEWARRVFVTAHDIAPEWHVRMQAAFQRHTDNAVSKTINFPSHATTADVAEAYLLAYREGCKGITIYRDGSRTGQVLSHVADGEGSVDPAAVPDLELPASTTAALVAGVPSSARPEALEGRGSDSSGHSPARRRLPDERQSLTHKFRVGEQEGFVTVGLFEDGTPGEISVTISKEGSTIRGLMDSVAMLTSYSLQYGVALRTLVEKFRGVHFEPAGLTANPDIPHASSLVDYIFRWLELRFLANGQAGKRAETAVPARPGALEGRGPVSAAQPSKAAPRRSGRRTRYIPPSPALPFAEIATGLLCPDCGSQLIFSEGCLLCRSCGFTRCG